MPRRDANDRGVEPIFRVRSNYAVNIQTVVALKTLHRRQGGTTKGTVDDQSVTVLVKEELDFGDAAVDIVPTDVGAAGVEINSGWCGVGQRTRHQDSAEGEGRGDN